MIKEFGGIEITPDYVNDLVEEWHRNTNMPTGLEEFIIGNTGWSRADYAYWFYTGELP